jgi:hypothetical protein
MIAARAMNILREGDCAHSRDPTVLPARQIAAALPALDNLPCFSKSKVESNLRLFFLHRKCLRSPTVRIY